MAWRAVPLSNSSIVFSAIACGSSKGTSTPRWSSSSSIACRHGLDYVFDALIWREQAERKQHIFSFGSEAVLVEAGIGKRYVGDSVGDEIDFVRRDVKHIFQDIGGLLAHDNETIRQSRNF